MHYRSLVWSAMACVALIGCGDDDPSPAAPLAKVEGTATILDLDATWTNPEAFYDFPFPSDLRLTSTGHPDAEGFPYEAGNNIFPTVFDGFARRPRFGVQSAAYFRFDGPMPSLDENAAIPADVGQPVLLIDIDAASPDRGKLYPTAAHVHAPDDYTPANMLAVGPYPGIILHPDRTYAFVVRRELNDAAGAPLGVPLSLVTLAAGQTPEGTRGAAVAALYAPLWDTLDSLGVERTDVAAATVFTTGDAVRENLDQSTALVAKYDVTIENVALDPDDGADNPRFCELAGTVVMPQFQVGTRPYNPRGEGLIDVDADGVPIQVGEQTVPVAFTIPKGPMPVGGYPLLYFIHGTGGVAAQVVDRGKITVPDGEPIKGEGPAYVVAEHGMAAFGAAMPFNPERDPGVGAFDYANQVNFSAFPFNFRQGTYEQRLLIEALETFTVDPATLAGCDGPSLPNGETAYHFNMSQIALMGQSMGASYANLLAAIEPKVVALAPSGSGTFSARFLMVSPYFGGVKQVVAAILAVDVDNVTFLHPGVQITQSTWEMADSLPSLPRQSLYPFEGHPTRHIYTPVSEGDEFFPTVVFNSMALGWGTQEAGEKLWDAMQTDMALLGNEGIASYPVTANRTSEADDPYTAVVVQYPGDGIANPHTIFSQLDEVKYQYGCFLSAVLAGGTATVPAPAALGTPCP